MDPPAEEVPLPKDSAGKVESWCLLVDISATRLRKITLLSTACWSLFWVTSPWRTLRTPGLLGSRRGSSGGSSRLCTHLGRSSWLRMHCQGVSISVSNDDDDEDVIDDMKARF